MQKIRLTFLFIILSLYLSAQEKIVTEIYSDINIKNAINFTVVGDNIFFGSLESPFKRTNKKFKYENFLIDFAITSYNPKTKEKRIQKIGNGEKIVLRRMPELTSIGNKLILSYQRFNKTDYSLQLCIAEIDTATLKIQNEIVLLTRAKKELQKSEKESGYNFPSHNFYSITKSEKNLAIVYKGMTNMDCFIINENLQKVKHSIINIDENDNKIRFHTSSLFVDNNNNLAFTTQSFDDEKYNGLYLQNNKGENIFLTLNEDSTIIKNPRFYLSPVTDKIVLYSNYADATSVGLYTSEINFKDLKLEDSHLFPVSQQIETNILNSLPEKKGYTTIMDNLNFDILQLKDSTFIFPGNFDFKLSRTNTSSTKSTLQFDTENKYYSGPILILQLKNKNVNQTLISRSFIRDVSSNVHIMGNNNAHILFFNISGDNTLKENKNNAQLFEASITQSKYSNEKIASFSHKNVILSNFYSSNKSDITYLPLYSDAHDHLLDIKDIIKRTVTND